MMTTKRHYLRDFPIVIDPLVQALEVRCSYGLLAPGDSWKLVQLGRLEVDQDTFPFSLDTSMICFFGPNRQPQDCPYILVYDASGRISCRLDRYDCNEFSVYRFPAEIRGLPAMQPTVRLSFRDSCQAQNFHELVRIVKHVGADNFDGNLSEHLLQLINEAEDVTLVCIASD